jgi:hypothetical protein
MTISGCRKSYQKFSSDLSVLVARCGTELRMPSGFTSVDRKGRGARLDAHNNRHCSINKQPALSNRGRKTMSTWLSEREQRLVAGAEAASAATPIPTQIVSNGEYLPPPQSATQRKVEARITELADLNGKHLGLSRR